MSFSCFSSFDPASIYCFLTVFSPFMMGGLLLLKVSNLGEIFSKNCGINNKLHTWLLLCSSEKYRYVFELH